MKRIWVLVLISMVFLCSCESNEVCVKFSSMSFVLKTEQYDNRYNISFAVGENPKSVSATVKNLGNMKYSIKNNIVTTEYEGLKLCRNLSDIKNDDVVILLYKALSESNGVLAKKKNSNYIFENENYKLIVSPKGLPLSITVKNKGIYAQFCNLTLVK